MDIKASTKKRKSGCILCIVLTFCMVLFLSPVVRLIAVEAATAPVDFRGRIASDGRIAAIIDGNHTLWIWGGSYGTEPQQVMRDAAYVALGGDGRTHFAVIKTDNTLWLWEEWSEFPKEPSMKDVQGVWVSSSAQLALQMDGTLWKFDSLAEPPAQLMTGAVSAFVLDNEIVVLSENGTVNVWYDYDYKGPVEERNDMADASAVLSTGGMGSSRVFPMKDGSLTLGNTHISDAVSFDVSKDRLVVVKSDHTLWEWTSGNGEIAQTMTDVAAASTSSEHTAILKTDGTLWLAGDKEWGLSGLGYNREWGAPEQVLDDVIYTAAAHSRFTSDPEAYNLILAVTADGSIWAWGNNASGQVGNGGAYDVGDEYNNYVINPFKVKDINMLSNEKTDTAAVAVEDTQEEGTATGTENAAAETDPVAVMEIQNEKESSDNNSRSSAAPFATAAGAVIIIVVGVLIYLKRTR